MGNWRWVGGSRLIVRLIALIVVPTFALGYFALLRIDDRRGASEVAVTYADRVDRQAVAARLIIPAAAERLGMLGLARYDSLGLDRQDLVRLAGLDFEALYEGEQVALDGALTAMRSSANPVISARSTWVTYRLAELRRRSEQQLATEAEINAVFDDLSELVDSFLLVRRERPVGHGELSEVHDQLLQIAEILTHAFESEIVALDGLAGVNGTTFADTALEINRQLARLDQFVATLNGDELAEANALRSTFAESAEVLSELVRTVDGAAIDQGVIQTATAVMVTRFEAMFEFQDFTDRFHSTAVATANDVASDARSDVRQSILLAVLAAVLTVVWAVFVLWSTLSSLGSLRRRALKISDGNLDGQPLTPRGPRELRELTNTMNSASSTLQHLDRHLAAVAAGDSIDPSEVNLPGELGRNVRRSIDRIVAVSSELQRSEAFASAVIAEADDAIWTIRPDGVIYSANHASERFTGMHAEHQVGQRIDDILSGTSGEATITRADGTTVPVLVSSSDVGEGGPATSVVIAHDISERSRFEARLAYQARHDSLTGLLNRAAITQYLADQIAGHQRPIGVMFMDLDGFKQVNDSYGHAAGDAVLHQVARRIEAELDGIGVVARLGGDEFLIVLPQHHDVDRVVEIGNSLIKAIGEPYRDHHQVFTISASIGVAMTAAHLDMQDVLRHADNAVYLAKRRGRQRVEVFDRGMQAEVRREEATTGALRDAVKNDELLLYLQPIVDMEQRRFVGAEALVRWNRPGVGIVQPSDFVPLAERTPIACEIGRWVIEQACERIAEWQSNAALSHLSMSVNVSARHLFDGDLFGDVDRAIRNAGVDAQRLELEFSEDQLLIDLGSSTTVLNRIRALGVRVAVDDFGTGCSSLSKLRRLPIDTMKFARSFVASATDDAYDASVVEAALTLGRHLELDIVAEGIETEPHLSFVRAHGFHRGQGYLLAHPAPVRDAEMLLAGPYGTEPTSQP